MTDRELLELAAKAAGIEYWLVRLGPRSSITEHLHVSENGETREWNPLLDDGDALRLAVTLHIDVLQRFVGGARCEALSPGGPVMREEGHSLESTRRAIVRAAAEIGKGMK